MAAPTQLESVLERSRTELCGACLCQGSGCDGTICHGLDAD
jgi:hypothetical protein